MAPGLPCQSSSAATNAARSTSEAPVILAVYSSWPGIDDNEFAARRREEAVGNIGALFAAFGRESVQQQREVEISLCAKFAQVGRQRVELILEDLLRFEQQPIAIGCGPRRPQGSVIAQHACCCRSAANSSVMERACTFIEIAFLFFPLRRCTIAVCAGSMPITISRFRDGIDGRCSGFGEAEPRRQLFNVSGKRSSSTDERQLALDDRPCCKYSGTTRSLTMDVEPDELGQFESGNTRILPALASM